MRSTDDKLASRIHKQLIIRLKQFLNILRTALLHSGNQDFFHVATDGSQHGGLIRKFVVLGGDDNAVDAFGFVPFGVLNGDL